MDSQEVDLIVMTRRILVRGAVLIYVGGLATGDFVGSIRGYYTGFRDGYAQMREGIQNALGSEARVAYRVATENGHEQNIINLGNGYMAARDFIARQSDEKLLGVKEKPKPKPKKGRIIMRGRLF